ncbi:MAG: T9SS type A sorting domain-containing protein [Bacteroidetes bacterium]|nr:T9SS type A sorting domain-containing protein [Bacteroidota bacterium]
MKKLFFTFVVFCFAWQANAQTEFAPIGAEWHYNYYGNYGYFDYIVSEKDTIVEGNNCRVLKQYFTNSNIANETYIIKQEQNKVYHYYYDQFNLLFDFDAKVGDTVEFTFMYKEYGNELSKDSVVTIRYSVESITINAKNLKTFTTKVLKEDTFLNNGLLPYTYVYTEKIGGNCILCSNYTFMPILSNAITAEDKFQFLRCYSDADFSFISNRWAETSLPCNYSYATSVDILQDKNLIMYPNPFNETVFVFASNGGNIEIRDILGNIVHCSEVLTGINEISTSHFRKGIYVVKIQNKDNSVQIFKIVKL